MDKPNKRRPYHPLLEKQRDRLASPKAMTLIAGIRCIDGFLVAADTALSDGGDIMYHGQKIDYYVGKDYQMVIACHADLSCAQTAARQINDKLASVSDLDVSQVIPLVEAELIDVHVKHIYPLLNVRAEAPHFSLIIGIECRGLCQVLRTVGTRVTKQEPYVFDGGGADLALTYAESFLRSRQNDSLPLYTSAALHIVDEIFRTVKRFRAAVGLDTRIFAWRSEDSNSQFFELTKNEQDYLWAIQENLKSAIWGALEQSDSDAYFSGIKDQPTRFLELLRESTKKSRKYEAHFISYTSMPQGNEAKLRVLDRWKSP